MRCIVQTLDEGNIQVAQGVAREFFARRENQKDLYEQVSCIVKNPEDGNFQFLLVSNVEDGQAVIEKLKQIEEISVLTV